MLPHAILSSHVEGRTRLRIPAMRRTPSYFEELARRLESLAGVEEVVTNPGTGSVLVYHRASVDRIARFASEQALFTLLPDGQSPPAERLAVNVDGRLRQLSQVLRRSTGNHADARSVAFFALVGAAVYQVLRGDVLPAATTLVGYALSVLPDVDAGEGSEHHHRHAPV